MEKIKSTILKTANNHCNVSNTYQLNKSTCGNLVSGNKISIYQKCVLWYFKGNHKKLKRMDFGHMKF